MKPFRHPYVRALLAALLATALAPAGPWAQQPAPAAPAPAPAPAAKKAFSQQDLDQLLAPIALYPDALVAQVLMASTYPLEVVAAARWSKANPKVTGKALEDAMQKQSWDPAVESLTSVPQLLAQMNEKLDWTQKLGEAFLSQQAEVLKTVQGLRAKAHAAGNLKTTQEQVVKTEVVESKTVYIIESAKPTVVYVPTYNPYTIYGTWWYPYPPYYMYPPAYVYPPGVAFATGVVVGAAIWGNTNWHGNSVNINVNQYNSYNKTTISSSNYTYNSAKVNTANVNQATKSSVQSQAQAQGVTKSSVQSQAQSQGVSQSSVQSQAQAQGASKSSAQSRAQGMSKSSAQSQAASAQSRASGSGISGAGTGSGAATREASARGGASRGGGGGRHR